MTHVHVLGYLNMTDDVVLCSSVQVRRKEGRKEMFYLTTHSIHFSYGYMASDIIWLRTILIDIKETRCRHIGYSVRLAARIGHTTAFVTPVVEHWLERAVKVRCLQWC